ncbi:MAG: hypothetical protein HN737_05870 [Desulfobacterales bacterium]|jgi:hypothetical protein|nr:hypothetical protein [Desulfobacteraceae bacterium]MBT4363244.1 hypothetical protein [Desulfobacteraceae bacterium]MBT7084832.1 hypothetical protein [Desulfobacterales bacterium]MBT7696918.1 hypothetical protein [Desulfobacterales bacterium]
MKNFDDLTYYEILNISPGASFFEIRRGYKEALFLYDKDSLVTYSLLDEEDRGNIVNTIEKAFNTLVSEDRRIEYDKAILKEGKVDESFFCRNDKKSTPVFHVNDPSLNKEPLDKKVIDFIKDDDEIRRLSEEILAKEFISGNDLKCLRNASGVRLEEVFEIARISVSILNYIENDEHKKLPPQIYLKNFLKSYAEILQIDSEKIVTGFLKNMNRFEK